MKTKNNKIKISACILFAFVLSLLCVVPAFAEMRQNMLSPEDGAVSDNGEHSPLDPEAGTIDGTDDGIISEAQSAFDSFGDVVTDAASDILGIGQTSDTANQTNTATGADTNMTGAENTGGNVAAAVIICIIIAIAVVILIIILVPKKKD